MSDILARLTTLTQKPKCHRSASRNRRRMPFASVVGVFSSGRTSRFAPEKASSE
jgi:hypothetical protein